MIQIAIVEDEDKEAEALLGCLSRYERENGERLAVRRYRNAFDFFEDKESFEIVFMDIMLPNMNGMEAAQRMRKYDSRTILIFVTNMTQFAIKSYEVDALDYVLKPVSYERVTFKLKKAIKIIRSRGSRQITVKSENGYVRIGTDQIYYVEVRGHKLTYVTEQGAFNENGSMTKLEEELKQFNFMRCNACYLVNPQYIFSVKGFRVVMQNGDELKISQPKHKSFMSELSNYLGQGKC